MTKTIRRNGGKVLPMLLGSLLLVSCSADTGRLVEVLYKGQHCPETNTDMVLLRSQSDIVEFVEAAGGGEVATLPPVNFPDEIAVALLTEPKPTGGYELELASNEARVINNKAVLDIGHLAPAEENVTQVLTTPCMVVKVNIRGIDVIERADTSATISIPGKDL